MQSRRDTLAAGFAFLTLTNSHNQAPRCALARRELSAIRRKAYTGIRVAVGLSVCADPGSILQAALVAVELPDGFHVRLARRDEAALLLDVMLRCWTGTVAENSSAYRETAETISQQLDRGGAAILFDGEHAIGAGRYYPVPGPAGDPHDWVEIKRVGILKSYRSQGLGPALVGALEDAARQRNFAGVQIGVRHDQPRLIAFWQSLGYQLADDVTLHTVNPLTPTPTFMRKRF